jgi:hypothetical protein
LVIVIDVVIEDDGWKQAKLEGGSEELDDLPRTEVLLMGVPAGEIEVELVGMDLGEEIAAAGEGFQVEELVFFEAVDGFDVALVGVSCGRDAHMPVVTESGGKIPFELTAVVGLPDQIAERDTVAIQVLLNAGSEDSAGSGGSFLREGPEEQGAAHVASSVLNAGQVELLGLRPVARNVVEILGISAD